MSLSHENDNAVSPACKPKQPKVGAKKDLPAKRSKSGADSPVDESVLDIILSKLDALQPFLEKANMRLDGIDSKLSKIDNRFKEAEKRINELENTVDNMTHLQTRIIQLEKACEQNENRNRRNNLRIYGIPEETESGDLCVFFAEFLGKLLNLNIPLDIQDAHRLGAKQAAGGTRRARGVIIYLLQRRHVNLIMEAVKKQDKLLWKGHQIYINRDLAKVSADNKKAFLAMRPTFRKFNIRYGFIHPSSFKITHNQSTKVYDNIDDLRVFLFNVTSEDMDTSVPSSSGVRK